MGEVVGGWGVCLKTAIGSALRCKVSSFKFSPERKRRSGRGYNRMGLGEVENDVGVWTKEMCGGRGGRWLEEEGPGRLK